MQRPLILVMTSMFFGGLAWAGEQAPTTGIEQLPTFSEVDANQNGLISSQEADPYPAIKEVFMKADTDKDGSLNSSEYMKAKPSKSGS